MRPSIEIVQQSFLFRILDVLWCFSHSVSSVFMERWVYIGAYKFGKECLSIKAPVVNPLRGTGKKHMQGKHMRGSQPLNWNWVMAWDLKSINWISFRFHRWGAAFGHIPKWHCGQCQEVKKSTNRTKRFPQTHQCRTIIGVLFWELTSSDQENCLKMLIALWLGHKTDQFFKKGRDDGMILCLTTQSDIIGEIIPLHVMLYLYVQWTSFFSKHLIRTISLGIFRTLWRFHRWARFHFLLMIT